MTTEKLIAGSQIKDDTINGSQKLLDDSVTQDKMAPGAVGATEIQNSSVSNAKISAVSGSKISAGTTPETALDAATQAKINNPSVSGLAVGDKFALFDTSGSLRYSESTSDLYKQTTPTNNFWHPAYSLAAFSTGAQTIGYNDVDNTTVLTATTNKQFYFAHDLVLGAGSEATNNSSGMYFMFEEAFKGIIWVGGTEVFNNLATSDVATGYTTKQGYTIVNVNAADAYITIGGTTRVAVVYKQVASQASLKFGLSYGTVLGGSQLVGLESFAFDFTIDNIGQGTTFKKITAAEYATLANIPSATNNAFLTAVKSDNDSKGGIIYNDDLADYVTKTWLATTVGAANVGFDDTSFGFSASNVQAAMAAIVANISSTLTFDNTTPALPGLGATPTIQEGINKLAYAANIHIDGTQWVGILTPTTYYVQNALDKLRDSENIRFDNTIAGYKDTPTTVKAALQSAANPEQVPYAYAGKLTATDVGGMIKELRDRWDDATYLSYNGVPVGIPATNVKDAIDTIALATSASNDIYIYDGGTPYATVQSAFTSLGVTLDADMDTAGVLVQAAITPLFEGVTAFKSSYDAKNTLQDNNIAAKSTTGDYYEGATAVSNDYAIPSLATFGSVDILLKQDTDWMKLEALYVDGSSLFHASYHTVSGVGISNDLTTFDINSGGSTLTLSVVGEDLVLTGTLASGGKALTRVSFD